MIRNAIRRFMYGRYGNDQLNLCLIVLYLALYLLFAATRFVPLYWLTVVLILAALFRTLSRNLTRRREENDRFLCLVDPAVRWLRLHRTIRRDDISSAPTAARCCGCPGERARSPSLAGAAGPAFRKTAEFPIILQRTAVRRLEKRGTAALFCLRGFLFAGTCAMLNLCCCGHSSQTAHRVSK